MKMPDGHAQNVSRSLEGKVGKNSRRWKGDNAGYHAKHMWIKKHFGVPDRCEQIGCFYPKKIDMGRKILRAPSRYEWANISGNYSRDREDWVMLCPSCHRKIDKGSMKLCAQ